MTAGVLRLAGSVLSPTFVASLEARIATQASARYIATRVGVSLVKPRLAKFIPYVGWAITIGAAAYAAYEAYNAKEVDWAKLQSGTYDSSDLAVFRMGFTMARQAFISTAAGLAAIRAKQKYILIPSEVMPNVADVDVAGITRFGNSLTWDPIGATQRRQAALKGRAGAGPFLLADGTELRGSWEEYPFAATYAPLPGAHIGAVPLRENWIQGGFITAASVVQGFRPSDNVMCYVL